MQNQKDLEMVKEKLEAAKVQLEAELQKLNEPVDMGDDIDSFDEETDEAVEFSANMGMVQTLKRRYHRVTDALAKLEQGTYGMCEKCGKEIEMDVLNVDPESRLCKACKLAKQ